MVRITPAHDPTVQVPFEIPIKGRKTPLKFTIPRLQYLPLPAAEAIDEWVLARNAKIAAATAGDVAAADEVARFKKTDSLMFTLQQLLDDDVYARVDALTLGEKLQIESEWEKASKASLGDSLGESEALSGS